MTKKFARLAQAARSGPMRSARIEEYARAIDDALQRAAVRNARGVTQESLAEELGVSQANVSRIEHEEDIYVSTPRA